MIPSRGVIAGVGIVIVAAAFAAGRLTAPRCAQIEQDTERSNTVLATGKAAGTEVQQVQRQDTSDHQQVRTVVKVVRVPGGAETTVTTKVETHDQATAVTLAQARTAWQSEMQRQVADIEREHVIAIAAARPDWSIAVIAGANVPDRERFVAGFVTRRILGPVELGAMASTRGDVGGALVVRW